MPNILRLLHRLAGSGGAGSPTAVLPSGVIALNFDVPAGQPPEAWGSDGTAWRRLNPAAAAPTVGTVNLPGGTAGSSTGIGAAWTTLTPKPSDPIIISTFGGTAYVKTGAGGTDSDWTALGSATSFATVAQILAGTVTDRAIAPDQLALAGLSAPTATPANDAARFVKLNSAGKIDPRFLSISGLRILGATDATKAPPALTSPDAYGSGDLYFVGTAGTADAGWTGVPANTPLDVGDTLLFDGAAWHVLEANLDPNAFLPLTGTSPGREMTDTARVAFAVPAGAAPASPVARLDGTDPAKSAIDNFTISGGTF